MDTEKEEETQRRNMVQQSRIIPRVCAWALVCAAVLLPGAANGQVGAREQAQPLVRAELIADTTHFVPGRVHRLGVVLTMREGWHTYWVNPGDTGLATTIELELPEGMQAAQVRWPVPERYVHGQGMLLDYVYSGTVVLQIPVTVSAEVEFPQQLTVRAKVEWLACQESCVPGDAELVLTLPVSASEPRVIDTSASLFAASDARMPLPASKAKGLTVDWSKNELRVRAAGARGVRVFPRSPSFPSPVDAIENGEQKGEQASLAYPDSMEPGTIVYFVVEIEGGLSAGVYDVTVGGDPRVRARTKPNQD